MNLRKSSNIIKDVSLNKEDDQMKQIEVNCSVKQNEIVANPYETSPCWEEQKLEPE